MSVCHVSLKYAMILLLYRVTLLLIYFIHVRMDLVHSTGTVSKVVLVWFLVSGMEGLKSAKIWVTISEEDDRLKSELSLSKYYRSYDHIEAFENYASCSKSYSFHVYLQASSEREKQEQVFRLVVKKLVKMFPFPSGLTPGISPWVLLPAHEILEGSSDGSSNWALSTHMADLDVVSGSSFNPVQPWTLQAFEGVNQQVGVLSTYEHTYALVSHWKNFKWSSTDDKPWVNAQEK